MSDSENISSSQSNTILFADLVASCLTIFGCSIIIAFYFFNKEVRNFPTRLIIYLTISDAIFGTSNLMNYIWTYRVPLASGQHSFWCTVEGMTRMFSSSAAFCFGSGMCYYVYQMNCKRIYWDIKMEIKLIIIVATYSIIMAIL